ncbi:vacuolar protein sorting-associated [Ochromonadaceae sp. CCMP2298]|nr:vacuolar protein sorting-associated [Ochromonadaceae sp. CCMP2298]|mmetsp:Transcript_19424/g.42095  ORF Transcript_19424/g.42095 Transcript_19424/m.42095 type:complete len:218 (-) Transcript_19424:295-948(-)
MSRPVPLVRQISEEMKLYDDSRERNQCEELADLYAIIKATELLEAAYSRDCITSDAYADACARTISQFKSTESALISRKTIESTEAFMREYDVDCPRAYERLVVTGVPATVLGGGKDGRKGVIVAETVQAFITTMDALRLGQRAVDEIQPLVSDVTGCLTRVPGLSADFEGVGKMRLWLTKLHDMRAHDEIEETETRQLLFDLESSYNAFHAFLKAG